MLNLGGLFFTLDADTRGLKNATNQLSAFGREVDQAFRGLSQGTVNSNFANGLLRQEKAVVSMLERVKSLQDQINRSPVKGLQQSNLFKDLNAAFEDFTRRMSSPVPLNTAQFSRTVANMNSQLRDVQREFTVLNNEAKAAAGAGIASLTNAMKGLGAASLLVQGHLGGMSTRFFALTAMVKDFGPAVALTSAGVAGLAAGIATMGTAALTSGRQMSSLNAAFNAVSGNTAVTAANFSFVKDVAAQTGADFVTTAESFNRFNAAAKEAGLSGKAIQDSFRGLAVEGATLQLTNEQLRSTFIALDQMLSKGTVQSQELRLQLGNQFPAAFAIAAKAVGKTSAELEVMLKKGQVVSASFVPAFVKAAAEIYHVDLSKPVETLNSSLGRLSNEWFYFGQAINSATNATGVYRSLIDGLSKALEGLSTHLPEIIGAIGALTGAVVGLGVAMVMPTIGAAIAGFLGLVRTLVQVRSAMTVLGTVAAALNAVMGANPAVRIATVFATLVAAIGGATLGYNLLKNAVDSNNASMGDVSGIEQQLKAQAALGAQTRSTTADIIRQIQVLESQAAAAMHTAVSQAHSVQNNGLGEQFKAGAIATYRNLTGQTNNGQIWTAETVHAQRFSAAVKDANEAQKNFYQLHKDMQTALGQYKNLPEQVSTPTPPVPKVDKGKHNAGVNRVQDYIEEMKGAEAALAELTSGNRDYKVAEDLAKAKEAINQMDPKELAKVARYLQQAGYHSGNLTADLASVITRTREAKEAARTYIQVWNDIDAGARSMHALNNELDYLKKGGSTRSLYQFDAINKAMETLKDIHPNTQAGQVALQGIQRQLVGVGIQARNTGDLLGDTTNALAEFYLQGMQAEKLVQVWANITDSTEKMHDQIQALSVVTAAYASQGGFGKIFNADIGEAASRAVQRAQLVITRVRELIAAGAPANDIADQAHDYLQLLQQLDQMTQAQEEVRKKAEQSRDSFRNMADDGLSAIQNLITGVDSLNDSLKNLTKSLLNDMWKQFIDNPIDNWLTQLGQKKGNAGAAGIDTGLVDSILKGVGQPANDNTKAVDSLGSAALTASGLLKNNFSTSILQSITQTGKDVTTKIGAAFAINQMAAAAAQASVALQTLAASSGGSTGGGILNAILKGVGKAAGAIGGGSGTFNIPGIGDIPYINTTAATGRAIGGPMHIGDLYKVNEPGQAGEYFIPSVNGYMSPRGTAANGGGNMIHVDASTTIDARGATQENLADLKRTMAERDQQLKKELPFIIDSRVRDSLARRRY